MPQVSWQDYDGGLYIYHVEVRVSSEEYDQQCDWCRENTTQGYLQNHRGEYPGAVHQFYFESLDDAMRFKLTWGGVYWRTHPDLLT